MDTIRKQILPHLAAIAVFLGVCTAYFSPQLQGKVIEQSDIIQFKGMAQEALSYYESTGKRTLWTNAMFGGMPTYQIVNSADGNMLQYVNKVLELGINRPIGRFFLAMLCFYIFMLSLNIKPWLGIIGAIAFGLSTNNFVIYEAGHVTKFHTIAYLPLLAAGVVLAFRTKYLLGGILLATGIGLNLLANHVQMTYYFGLTLFIYGIAQLIYDVRNGKILDFAKAAGVLLIAGVLGIGASALNLLTTYEYGKDTMRGEPILEKTTTGEAQSSSETDGLAWNYAMQWSNGTLDLFSAFIPGVVGGSSAEKVSTNSAFAQVLRRAGQSADKAPLYWGSLPFTSGTYYFGAGIIFLFFMGLILVNNPIKWWLGIGTLLTFLFSMGSNAEVINRFFFDYIPLFNKFRTPNSALSVTVVLVVALAVLALTEIVQQRDRKKEILRSLYIALGITGSIALLFAFLGGSMFDFTTSQEMQYQEVIREALIADRKSMMQNDALRSLLIVLLTAGLVWAFLHNRIQLTVLSIGLALITIVDLFQIGRRYLDSNDFVAQRNYEQRFQPRPVDQQILAAEPHRGAYRVMDYSINTFNVSSTSYFHNTIGGHHAAKLQRIQDMIDRHISQQNGRVLDMFNTKYIIFGEPGKEQIQQNPNALGNAWFIDTLIIVPNANAEIDALSTFNPANQAIVHQDFADYVKGFDPSPNGNILLTDYKPDHLTYQSTTTSEQLAVFSEVWYDKGWNVYIDDAPADYIRVNYILRALRVPAGTHKIEFKFEPRTYAQGRAISFIASSIILLLLLGFIGYQLYHTFTTLPKVEKVAHTESATTVTQPVKKVMPTAKTNNTNQKVRKPNRKK
jgi:hypothetical protein